jgi:hypothetical protein
LTGIKIGPDYDVRNVKQEENSKREKKKQGTKEALLNPDPEEPGRVTTRIGHNLRIAGEKWKRLDSEWKQRTE